MRGCTRPVELLERVAVVAGVAGAIGAAVARRFAAAGARIVLADEDEEALAHIREELRQAAQPVDGLAVDLTSTSARTWLSDRALARFGPREHHGHYNEPRGSGQTRLPWGGCPAAMPASASAVDRCHVRDAVRAEPASHAVGDALGAKRGPADLPVVAA